MKKILVTAAILAGIYGAAASGASDAIETAGSTFAARHAAIDAIQ